MGLLSTPLTRKKFLNRFIGHQTSNIESSDRGREGGGTIGREGLTMKGDEVNGVIGKDRKARKKGKNKG